MFETESAAEACKVISSKAEEIKAHYDGAKKAADAAWGWMSPNNYRSENEVKNEMRNNFNIDMSVEDVRKIRASCNNMATSVGSNVITTNSNCKFCLENGCPYIGNVQRSSSANMQDCGINVAIDVLLKKTDSVDALALAKTLQDAQGLLASNKATNSSCNNINKDMSTKSYLESITECGNAAYSSMVNELSACGPNIGNIQEHMYSNFQKCVAGMTTETEQTIESETKLDNQTESVQTSVGVELPSISVGSSFVACGLIFLVVIVGGLGYVYKKPVPAAIAIAIIVVVVILVAWFRRSTESEEE